MEWLYKMHQLIKTKGTMRPGTLILSRYPVCLMFCLICNLMAAQSSFKIVGYYSLASALKDPDTRSFKYLTHINLAFLNPDSSGNFSPDLSLIKSFVDKAHKRNIKVLFSIGGGSKQPQYLRLLQDEQRAGFIQNLVAEVLKYNLDGIDMDLEGGDIT
ncbi:MAG: glycosyl hydrolase family 18 protein, partial [Saprospiraceae bacterium]